MKGKSILFAVAALALPFSCAKVQEEQPEAYTLEVDCDELEFGPDKYTATVYVFTNAEDWTYTESASWLEFEKDGNNLKLTATPNNSGSLRHSEICICAIPMRPELTKTIPVTQFPEKSSGDGEDTGDDSGEDFSDPAFWEAVSGYDADGDGKLSAEEALRITELDLSGLDKLEYVACGYNLIESINLKGCTSLKQLYFCS